MFDRLYFPNIQGFEGEGKFGTKSGADPAGNCSDSDLYPPLLKIVTIGLRQSVAELGGGVSICYPKFEGKRWFRDVWN